MPPFVPPFNASYDRQCLPNFGLRRFLEGFATPAEEREKGLHFLEAEQEYCEEGEESNGGDHGDEFDTVEDRSGADKQSSDGWQSEDNMGDTLSISTSNFDEVLRCLQRDCSAWEELWYATSGDDTDMREKRLERAKPRDKLNLGEAWHRMWTTPGLRPLAESLILDWDWFFREKMPSDARYKALFPDDPGKRSRIKDLVGEFEALTEYSGWALMRKDDPVDVGTSCDSRDQARRTFYGWLHEDLNIEKDNVSKEYDEIFASANPVAQFEYSFLDDDGAATTRIEEYLQRGADVFKGWAPEVADKYRHLLPPGYVIDHFATFEWKFHDRDGGLTKMLGALRAGDDLFCGWPSEKVVQKYGHLRATLPRWARWSADNVKKYGRNQWWDVYRTKVHEHSDGKLCVESGCDRLRTWYRHWYSEEKDYEDVESSSGLEAGHKSFDETLETTLELRGDYCFREEEGEVEHPKSLEAD